jgi:adenylyltransferase/sulfurtransferase
VILVDTRSEVEFGICALPDTISMSGIVSWWNADCRPLPDIPFSRILSDSSSVMTSTGGGKDITFICRKGNDSFIAARHLRSNGYTGKIRDVKGGYEAWSRDVDPEFPTY